MVSHSKQRAHFLQRRAQRLMCAENCRQELRSGDPTARQATALIQQAGANSHVS